MTDDLKYIDNIVKGSAEDRDNKAGAGWTRISRQVAVNNFLRFGRYHFNIYYASVIAALLIATAVCLIPSDDTPVVEESNTIEIKAYNEAQEAEPVEQDDINQPIKKDNITKQVVFHTNNSDGKQPDTIPVVKQETSKDKNTVFDSIIVKRVTVIMDSVIIRKVKVGDSITRKKK